MDSLSLQSQVYFITSLDGNVILWCLRITVVIMQHNAEKAEWPMKLLANNMQSNGLAM